METIFQIRKLLINPKTNDFYSNPYVIHEGDRRGETEDGKGASNKYSNKVISNIIEQNGDILTSKAGIISKIVAENGTPISNVGDYIEKDRIVIEGKIYTRTNEVLDVEAKGSIFVENEYVYSNTYSYKQFNKNYTGKEKYSIGVDINNKENYINYLDKSLKYDIIKNSSDINLFGNNVSFCFYKFLIYDLEEYYLSREDILDMAKKDAARFLNDEILPNCKDAVILSEDIVVTAEDEETVSLNVVYKINEEVGYFKGR